MKLHPSALRDLAHAIITTRRYLQRGDVSPLQREFNAKLLAAAEERYLRLTGRNADEALP